ncbi:MAG TPA: bifunctional DNA-formamidopyrimidine glycosylase/DNA-(apurinic or apyrimidinic site) lyase [Gammaproteobacteria bacterium]|nr:bifunctional DNA-formamidopyrimidine glycosylase/DNA-(apurinic or apyrimidinic site) lyase [Gammaproteobacteria bacterium]
MPELPEVETTRRGIAPHLTGRTVQAVAVRQRRLRWPVPEALDAGLPGQRIERVARRAKYLLLETRAGHVILHLGMSGSLRLVGPDTPPGPHDHVDLCLDSGDVLRLTDPRRFGCLLWTTRDPMQHPLLRGLGPEPLSDAVDGGYLYRRSRGRRAAVKQFIMDGRIVVGVGNIYASESLYRSGIHPGRAAGRISRRRYQVLAAAIKAVLEEALAVGGTTLRDFTGGDGRPGYFRQALQVYGRAREACRRCDGPVTQKVIGQRSTYYCPRCQH